MTRIEALSRGDPDNPLNDVRVDVEQDKGLPTQPIAVTPITSYKDYKDYKDYKADEFSEIILRNVPRNKRFVGTQRMSELVAQVKQHGTSYKAIEALLAIANWADIETHADFVNSVLNNAPSV
jgi:hypothetical protein